MTEIVISENVIETVYNSLRASHRYLYQKLQRHTNPNEKEILEHQIKEVKEALAVFEKLL
jgi:hypothetical protein